MWVTRADPYSTGKSRPLANPCRKEPQTTYFPANISLRSLARYPTLTPLLGWSMKTSVDEARYCNFEVGSGTRVAGRGRLLAQENGRAFSALGLNHLTRTSFKADANTNTPKGLVPSQMYALGPPCYQSPTRRPRKKCFILSNRSGEPVTGTGKSGGDSTHSPLRVMRKLARRPHREGSNLRAQRRLETARARLPSSGHVQKALSELEPS